MAEAKAFKMIPHCTKDTIRYEMDELVMCKDCKWFEVHPANQLFGWEESYYCNNPRLTDQEGISTNGRNWFCADGEKRTD